MLEVLSVEFIVQNNQNIDSWMCHYFSHGHRRKAGRELQTKLDTMINGGGPLAKNQPEPVTGP